MDVKSLLVKIGSDVSEMQAGFKKADAIIQKNSEKFKKAGRIMTAAGGAILGSITGVVKAYGDFDQAMKESTAIMGDVSDAMKKKMAEAAKEMSGGSTFASKELAKAYFFLASAGLDAEQSIAALPVVTKFAQAGAFDLASATDLLTDAQSALGLSSKDAAENQENMIRVSDVLVAANTLANASVGQFSEALTNKAAPSMRAYGVELEEGVAVLAAFADQGIKGRRAGEQYSIILRDMQKAAQENKTAFENAGIAVYDANGNLNNMGKIVEQLEGRFEGMSAEQKKAELAMLGFQEESQAVLLTLVGTSQKIKEYEKNLKSAQGATEEVADKQLKSLTNQLKLAKNSIMNAAISLGEQLAPMVVEIAGKIKNTVEKIRDWIKEHPELTRGIATTALKVGVLLAVLGPITMMLPGLVTGISLLGGAFTVLTGPVGLATAAIVGIVLAVKDMAKTLDEAKKEMKDFADESTVFANAADNFQKLWIVARQEGGETLEQFNELMKRFGGNWESIMKTIIKDPKFATLKALLLDIANGVKTIELEGRELSIRLPKNISEANKPSEELAKTLKLKLAPVLGMTAIKAQEMQLAWANLTDVLDQEAWGQQVDIIDDVLTESELARIELEATTASAEVMGAVFEAVGLKIEDWGMKVRDESLITKKTWEDTFDSIMNCGFAFIDGLDAAFAQAYTNQMIRIDNEEKRRLESIENTYNAELEAANDLLALEEQKTKEKMDELDAWYEAQKEEILNNITDEEERKRALEKLDKKLERKRERLMKKREKKEQEAADAIEAIEEAKDEALKIASEDLEEKRAAARRTAAKQEKAVALLNAIVNTAAAIVKALPNIPLSIIVGAMGAVQIALIKAQPIPLAEGGVVTKPTRALIGERGPEAVIPLKKIWPDLTTPAGMTFKQNNYFYGNISNVGDLDEISRQLAEKTRRALERGRR